MWFIIKEEALNDLYAKVEETLNYKTIPRSFVMYSRIILLQLINIK